MTRLCLITTLLVLAQVRSVQPLAAADKQQPAVMAAPHLKLLHSHCAKCHDAKTQEGKFRVDDLPAELAGIEAAERWQKILNALNAGEMPPEGETQLPAAAKADLLDDLASAIVIARKQLSDSRGEITLRRLNRREFHHSLRELLGVDINVSELPADTGSGTFDTVGSNLFMSANQFEQYLALGREALDEAFERYSAGSTPHKFRYELEESTPKITQLVRDELDAKRRGLEWIKAVEAAAARPENAKIVATIRQTATSDAILRRSWEKITGAPSPESFGFQTGENNADKANRAATNLGMHPYHHSYLQQPALQTGGYLTVNDSLEFNTAIRMLVPFNWPPGDYLVRVRVASTPQATPERKFLEFGIHPRHGQVMSTHQITGTMDKPQTIEIPLTLTRKHNERDNRTLFVREKGTADHIEQSRRVFNDAIKRNGVGPEFATWVDWFEIERLPLPATSLPSGLAALRLPIDNRAVAPPLAEVRSAFERFATEAFRGKTPEKSYLDRLQRLYEVRLQAGDKHPAALKETLAVVFASPAFLYLTEPTNGAKTRTLNDAELAARLSFFLWGAPPDAELRELAARQRLSQPAILAAQTDRLLNDPRSRDFTRSFLYQWFDLDRLDFFTVNRQLYPRFDDSTKLAARHEVYETFEHLFRHHGSLRELLHSDYVVINSVLARFYDLPGIEGDQFRRVALPPGSPRGGLLGMAAINLMGSNGERTSPVERGAWVLRKLLDDAPPPAPANVPQIARLADRILTTRERLAAHQEDAQCASCHRKIDPLGLGLENFDAVGQWRTEDFYQVIAASGKPDPKQRKTWPIEAAATLHKGPAFQNYFELRGIIAGKSDNFARSYTKALIEYALGRPCGFSDEPLVAAIVERAAQKNLDVREFVQALVASDAFRTK